MKNKKIIGVSGFAGAGKDTYYNLYKDLHPELIVKRFAFADELKNDIAPFLLEKLNIDIYNISPEQKTSIRPFMVWYGCYMREIDPLYWVKKTCDSMCQSKFDVAIITDIRFENEAKWLKENNGTLVYIHRILQNGKILPAANTTEGENAPKVEKLADKVITWPTIPLEELKKYV